MSFVKQFYSTTVGKKVVMACTGLVLFLFVLGHMLGNLKMFAGIDPATGRYKLDLYAEFLREIGAAFMGHETFLWITRATLLLCLVLHVISAIQLSILNRKAKPVAVHKQSFGSANPASRTMLYGGLFLLAFVTFHILHLTTGTVHQNNFQHGAVYSNVYLAFQSKPVMIAYVFAMACLMLHLYHGTWSMFQTLGVDTPSWNCGFRLLAKTVAVVLFIGFIAVPVASGMKLIPPPVETVIQQASH